MSKLQASGGHVVRIKGAAVEVWDDLSALAAKHGGLTPAVVMKRARALEKRLGERSPYHTLFTWDQQDAFDKLHAIEAGELIRRWRIEIVDKEIDVRAFISTEDGDRRTYRSVDDVADHPALAEAYKNALRARMAKLAEDLAKFEEYEAVRAAIRQALAG